MLSQIKDTKIIKQEIIIAPSVIKNAFKNLAILNNNFLNFLFLFFYLNCTRDLSGSLS